MVRWVVPALLLMALVLSPMFATPAQGADVNIVLYGKDLVWRVGSETSTATRIAATVGDTLRLRIENKDNLMHTFTAPQFQVNESLDLGEVAFWNHTVSAADVGEWQYYCIPHSGGTYPNRVGMVGIIAFSSPAPPQQPIDAVLVIVAIIVVAGIAGGAWYAMRRKK